MKYFGYLIIGIIVFIITGILTFSIGDALGAAQNDAGLVVIAISLLCAVMVICTLRIVDAIKNRN